MDKIVGTKRQLGRPGINGSEELKPFRENWMWMGQRG
jgi:hypothetical protein